MANELEKAVLGTASLSIGSDNIPQLEIEPLGNNTFEFSLTNMPNVPLRILINPRDDSKVTTYLIHNNETLQIRISVEKAMRSLS